MRHIVTILRAPIVPTERAGPAMTAADEIRFTAPDGVLWTVYEISAHSEFGSRRSLIFVSDEGFRRVYHFPENWRELSPAALYELSWRT